MSTTMIALGLAAVGTQPCGLDQTLSHVLSRPHPEAAAFLNGSKEERDAFGLPSSMSSDNFVLRWGEGSTASDEELASLLASFELAWAAQFEDWGYPQPVGTDAYKFNVYVGNTHEAGPDIDGAWGYFTVDADDHPYIVMDPRTVTDVSQGQITSAHELFHAAQHATGNYSSLNRSWYWEATATWAAETLHPDSGEGLELLYRYALSPHQSSVFDDQDGRLGRRWPKTWPHTTPARAPCASTACPLASSRWGSRAMARVTKAPR